MDDLPAVSSDPFDLVVEIVTEGPVNTPAVFALDIKRGEASDGSGRGIDIESKPDYNLTGADPNHRSASTEFANGRTKHTDYRAGNVRSPITGPLARGHAAHRASPPVWTELKVPPRPQHPSWLHQAKPSHRDASIRTPDTKYHASRIPD